MVLQKSGGEEFYVPAEIYEAELMSKAFRLFVGN